MIATAICSGLTQNRCPHDGQMMFRTSFRGGGFSFPCEFSGRFPPPSPHHSLRCCSGQFQTSEAKAVNQTQQPPTKTPQGPHLSWICLVGDILLCTMGFITIFSPLIWENFLFPTHSWPVANSGAIFFAIASAFHQGSEDIEGLDMDQKIVDFQDGVAVVGVDNIWSN